MKIRNRQGNYIEFDVERIRRAIDMSCYASGIYANEEQWKSLLSQIEEECISFNANVGELGITDIERIVVLCMMEYEEFRIASIEYVEYRVRREYTRGAIRNKTDGILSSEFISKYKKNNPPMPEIGQFTFLRTYSRFLQGEGRREHWWEVVKRAVEYNCSLVPTTRDEAESLFDNIFNLRQFLSGRTFWVGGTEASKQYPMSNFNCSFLVVDKFSAFRDLFYVLMIGTGAGVRILKSDIAKLPALRTDIEVIHEAYVESKNRQEYTSLIINGTEAVIEIGDSKEAWAESINLFFELLHSHMYRKISRVRINYNNIRPAGAILKTFGGRASGHTSIMSMFTKVYNLIEDSPNNLFKLRPIHALDIANIIGENVVAGGVRRTAEIALVDMDDIECINAKKDLYKLINGEYVLNKDIEHRQMSNNSIYYKEQPSFADFKENIKKIRYSGEPGWVNEEAGAKRRTNFNGVNPCGEILLDDKGLCNLTTVNVFAFVNDGVLDTKGLLKAQRLSARSGYRMSCVELELHEWDIVQQRDKVIGCSLTGWQDMVNAVSMSKEAQIELLQQLRQAAHDACKELSSQLGMEFPIAITTVKPEGTLSLLPTVSSGVHYSHSPYYIRRIRINAFDPLVQLIKELKYPVFPEVGYNWSNCKTVYVEFPVKAPEGITKGNVSAKEQLDNYLMFMKHYVDHNCSITIHVRNDEWETITRELYSNWDDIVAVSLLSYDDSFYEALPYEECTKEEYEKRLGLLPVTVRGLQKYEKIEEEFDIGTEGCEAGICPIR